MSLFGGVLTRGDVAAAVADEAWLTALLQVEAALAQVHGFSGVIEQADADMISAVCRAENFTLKSIAEGGCDPIEPLIAQLRLLAGPAAASVHLGASSQDVLDTAGMLVAAQALRPLLADLAACAEQAARFAREHRDTPMAGRTQLRQSVPVTFGLKAAGWLGGLDAARRLLEQVRRDRLAVQFGGDAGTLAPFGADGPDLVEGLATLLGLNEPTMPWHTERTRIAELAGALGTAAGAVAKVARDLTLLSQDEVGEITYSPSAGSAAVCALGCAGSAPGLVANLLAAMPQEHERAAGGWQAEWRPLRELLALTGSAASWLRTALEGMLPDPGAMRANLTRGGRSSATDDAAGVLVDRALQAHLSMRAT